MDKDAKLKSAIAITILLLFVSFLVFGLNPPDVVGNNLAAVVNGKSILEPRVLEYLGWHNNFEDFDFEYVESGQNISVVMKTKREGYALRGYEIAEKNYVVHLIICNRAAGKCFFRVNGLPTGWLYAPEKAGEGKPSAIDFNGDYQMRIESVDFDFCYHKRFCNSKYEAHDVVNVRIERR